MHAHRLPCWPLAAMLCLLLAACGEDAPTPPVAGDKGVVTEQVPSPAVDPVPRLFVQIGPGGHLDATFGRASGTGILVASGQAAGSTEVSALQAALRRGFLEVLSDGGATKPILQIQALPGTPWSQVAAVLAVAAEPEVGLTQVDLRLPWDVTPKAVELFALKAQEPLRIAFAPLRTDDVVQQWRVRIAASSPSLLQVASDDAARKQDEASIKHMRGVLKDLAAAWQAPLRRAEIAVPITPSPSYVNVLTLVRLCGERGFGQVRFVVAGE